MSRSWTPQQKNAIEANKGSILVSAAAGSGKTAVLVERVIRLITGKEHPVDADRLLIVTFTRAAAAEMRERIAAALAQQLKKEPDNTLLHRQQLLLPNAQICTIDSFCGKLVRDNFEKLDISPDFGMADEAQQRVLRDTAMESTMRRMYEQDAEDFSQMSMLLYNGRNDAELFKLTEKLYDSSRAYPFPGRWLDSLTQEMCAPAVEQTYFGSVIIDHVADAVSYCRRLNHVMEDAVLAQNNKKLSEKLLPCIVSDRERLDSIAEAAENREWDRLYEEITSFAPERKGIVPKEFKDSPVDCLTKRLRENIKKTVSELKDYMCTDNDEYRSDGDFFKLPVLSLIKAVKLFSEEYDGLKRERNLLDFSDIEQFAIKLLVKDKAQDGSVEVTELARTVSEQYEQILLDEYQDTNEAQDIIFRAVSREEKNLFRVGDVKQCIYCFRQAMPDIFVRLRQRCVPYTENAEGENFSIYLDKNFRSRAEVTDTVNYLFSRLMRRECGDVDYDESETLKAAADYAPSGDKTSELHLLTLDEESEKTADEQQAEYTALAVRELLDSGMTVKDGNTVRPLRKSDICILMRNLSSKGEKYALALKGQGIDCYTQAASDFFEATEVSVVLSLLRVIDNPCQDIPLLSVMLSALYGFTADELTRLRTACEMKGGNLYSRAVALAQGDDTHFAALVQSIATLRLYATSLCTHELLARIYESTGYYAAVGAMKNGAKRQANLSLLVQYAAEYEARGLIGLPGFIRFIDKLRDSGKALPGTVETGDSSDAVKIMTIHKSKGLEFPVVILASCSSPFNKQDEKGCAVVDAMHGLGIKMRQEATLAQFDTVSRAGAKLSLKKRRISEEMRILYVALTRAKEKLIMVCAAKHPEKELTALADDIFAGHEPDSFCTLNAASFSEWILSAFLRHPDATELRNTAGLDDSAVIAGGGSLCVKMPVYRQPEAAEAPTQQPCAQPLLTDAIAEKLAFRYAYDRLLGILTKQTASAMAENSVGTDSALSVQELSLYRPTFMDGQELTAEQKGTAMHRFMQLCDYEKAKADAAGEIKRLRQTGLLTDGEAQAVDSTAIQVFFGSALYERIRKSAAVYREKKFMIRLPLRTLYPDLPEDIHEEQLIQGVADCAFEEDGELVIVDFKTDRVDEAELSRRYAGQLAIYKKALTLCTGLKVKQTLLWSFATGKTAEVFCP